MRIFYVFSAETAASDAGRIHSPRCSAPLRSRLRNNRLSIISQVCALAAALAIAGCGEIKRSPSGALSVTVAPGETGTCAIAPCRIFLEMPPGDGEYRVTGNQIDFGSYPAGKTVNLGDFYEPQAIEIVGAGVPRAYVYLPIYR
ncbi:MAG: hypothetical protein K9M02_18080 [Thiohalocapsa sp.]|nr:hypothetical protein [Thiohalocapsa sp.]